MAKGVADERMIFFVGVLIICLLAITFLFLILSPMLESNKQAQAKIMANMIAISANTLKTVDSGYLSKEFVSGPMKVEVYDKGGVSMAKVTYGENKGEYYEVPLLVNIPGMNQIASMVSVIKSGAGISAKGEIEGTLLPGEPASGSTYKDDYRTCIGTCIEPTEEQKRAYIKEAVKNNMPKCMNNEDEWEAMIKAVIMQETCDSVTQCFNHCKINKGVVLEGRDGDLGFMQITHWAYKPNGVLIGDPCNPKQNIMIGSGHLKNSMEEFNCQKEKAFAAYNGGSSKIHNAINNCINSGKIKTQCTSWDQIKYFVTNYAYVQGVNYYLGKCYWPAKAAACPVGCKLC